MIVWSASKGPVELAIGRGDGQVVDAGDAQEHQALVVELPILVPVGPEMLAADPLPAQHAVHGHPRHAILCDIIAELYGIDLGTLQ
jgi:hypothetical protein